MGFWPFKKKSEKEPLYRKALEFTSPEGPPSPHLQAALDEAAKRPLDDMVWRLVIAYPGRYIICDVGLMTMSIEVEQHEKTGLKDARWACAQVLGLTFDKNVPVEGEFGDTVRFAAMAFFDGEFTRGANRGKTNETAWNTLALEVETAPETVRVGRRAVRVAYPDGVPDLNSPFGGLFNPFR